jgi:hypothetical protein
LLKLEAAALRKALVYSVFAILLGLLLVLVPLVTLAGIGAQDNYKPNELFSERLEQLDGRTSNNRSSTSDVESLALSFIIVLAAFVFLRRRRPQFERRMAGTPWYYSECT